MSTNDSTHTTDRYVREATQLTEFHTQVEEEKGNYHAGDEPTQRVAVSFTSFDARKDKRCNEILADVIKAHANEIIIWIREHLEKGKVQPPSSA